MTFEGLLHWLEKKRDENLADDEISAEQPVLPGVTSEGGVKLPPMGASHG